MSQCAYVKAPGSSCHVTWASNGTRIPETLRRGRHPRKRSHLLLDTPLEAPSVHANDGSKRSNDHQQHEKYNRYSLH